MEDLKPEKKYVYFGTYPQSKKAESVTVGTEADENGYYTGSDGEKYAIADGEYFKVEPIKWRILQEQGGTAFLWSESILANRRFDSSKNNYAQSEIRSWLNGEFYQRAFCAAEKERIVMTDVDNGAASTGYENNPYACANTRDNVFLLSYREAFKSFHFTDDDCQKQVTPYAVRTGACLDTDRRCGAWWFRSPADGCNDYARAVDFDDYGDFDYLRYVYCDGIGVAPALRIKL